MGASCMNYRWSATDLTLLRFCLSSVRSTRGVTRAVESAKAQAEINIFTVASGLPYEVNAL